MLDEFEPGKLLRSLEAVRVEHPFDASAEGVTRLSGSETARRLIETLKRTPDERLGNFARGLTKTESKLIGLLVSSQDTVARMKAVQLCMASQGFANFAALSDSVQRYWNQPSSALASSLLTSNASLVGRMNDSQKRLFGARSVSPLAGIQCVLERANKGSVTVREWMGLHGFEIDSRFHHAVRYHSMTRGTRDAWQLIGRKDFTEAFVEMAGHEKITVVLHAYDLFRGLEEPAVARMPRIAYLAAELQNRTDVLNELDNSSPEAARWLRTIQAVLELVDFFDKIPDAERFDFWKRYIHQLDSVRGDAEFRRLFLDFGGFGVIEFAETNNATYVYPPEWFREMVRKNFKERPTDHGVLKNQAKAIKRLSHTANWRTNFARAIQRLREEY